MLLSDQTISQFMASRNMEDLIIYLTKHLFFIEKKEISKFCNRRQK